jgi:ketosteroid isomerase-like protein
MSANNKELELELEQIKDLIHKFVNMEFSDNATSFLDVFAPEAIMIRPSGNPLGQKLWEEMHASKDIVRESNELLSIDKIEVLSNNDDGTLSISAGTPRMAYAIFITHTKFIYKGTPNDDVAVYSIVLTKKSDGGQWKIVHSQRSMGRKPDEPRPDFSNV